jgi:hypothetical protein
MSPSKIFAGSDVSKFFGKRLQASYVMVSKKEESYRRKNRKEREERKKIK